MNSDFSDFIRFFPIFRLFPKFRLLDSTSLLQTDRISQKMNAGPKRNKTEEVFWKPWLSLWVESILAIFPTWLVELQSSWLTCNLSEVQLKRISRLTLIDKLLMKKSQNWGTCWIAPGSVQVDRLLTDFLIYTWTFNVNPHMLRRTPSPPYKLYKTLLIFFT